MPPDSLFKDPYIGHYQKQGERKHSRQNTAIDTSKPQAMTVKIIFKNDS